MRYLKFAVLVSALLLVPVAVFAVPITGTSTGTLSNISGDGAALVPGTNYEMSWGGGMGGGGMGGGMGGMASTLTAGTGGHDAISRDYAASGGLNVHLASLKWDNKDNLNNTTVQANWNVTIDLSDPSGSYSLPADSLSISLKKMMSQDTLTLDDLSGLVWSFSGWEVKNFHYMVGTASVGTQWKTSKGDCETLWLTADFTRCPVPEPATFLLVGSGIFGLAAFRKTFNRA